MKPKLQESKNDVSSLQSAEKDVIKDEEDALARVKNSPLHKILEEYDNASNTTSR